MSTSVTRYAFLLLLISVISSCSNYYSVIRKPEIYDGEKYGRVELPSSEVAPFKFYKRSENIVLPPLSDWANKKEIKKFDSTEDLLANSATTAFLVIRNDSIIFEEYYNGTTASTASQLFSITKPLIVSLMMQAKEEGLISTYDEKVSKHYNFRKENKNCEQLTLKHLANMQSGFNHYDYFRLFKIVKLYHAKNVDEYIPKAKVSRAPGGKFKYKSFDTQILGTCLENIFEEDDLLERFTNLYWQNIRPEHKGYFSVDSKEYKNLKYYGGLNLSARDLAKIGKLYLQNGQYDGEQILSEDWMNYLQDSTNFVGKWNYNMGWYFDEYEGENRPVFYGAGFNGQYLVMNKATNTIIIRLGTSKQKHEWYHILSELSTKF